MKKSRAVLLSLVCAAVLFLGGCKLFETPKADGVYPYDWATDNGYTGSEGEWLSSLETPQTLYRRLFEEARAEGYTGTFSQFLRESELDVSSYVQRALCSVVSIECTFSGLSAASGGSGVVLSCDKTTGDMLVVTNYHVVYEPTALTPRARSIELWLYGGETEDRKLAASYLCGAMEYDIALLRVEGETVVSETKSGAVTGTHKNADVVRDSAVCSATWGDSDGLAVADPVYAVGYPLGEGISLTAGVVSRDAEYIRIERSDNNGFIELLEIRTDAAVNHGNSGGGLFNDMGELVGIVNARSEKEGVEAFGYAIPSSLVRPLLQNMIDRGGKGAYVADPGFTVQSVGGRSVYDETTERVYIEEKTVVLSIGAGAASTSGLQIGDTVLSASLLREGETAETAVFTRVYMLDNLLLKARLGDTLVLVVSRDGETKTVQIPLKVQISFREYN